MSKAKSKLLPHVGSVTPHIVCAGAAKAIAFYVEAFGAHEEVQLAGPDGRLIHGCVRIGNSYVMLVDEMPEWGSLGPKTLKGTPVTIHLMVDDVDSFIAKAVKAGAELRMPPTDMFWGDRYGAIVDPFGHNWSIATHLRDMTIDEVKEAMTRGPEGPDEENAGKAKAKKGAKAKAK